MVKSISMRPVSIYNKPNQTLTKHCRKHADREHGKMSCNGLKTKKAMNAIGRLFDICIIIVIINIILSLRMLMLDDLIFELLLLHLIRNCMAL